MNKEEALNRLVPSRKDATKTLIACSALCVILFIIGEIIAGIVSIGLVVYVGCDLLVRRELDRLTKE
jgi:hypothetical protein